MESRKSELVSLLAQECSSMEDIHGLLRELFKGTIEEIVEAEMDERLGYEKHSTEGDKTGNNRNGAFEPQLIEKYQTKSNNLEQQIIAMYQKGMSTRDIEDHLRDIYGIDAPPALISRVTDKIMPQLQEWQSRTLDSVYPIVFLDGIVFKVRKDSKVINKCAYTVLGINMDGKKEVLGIWISENESSSFWTTVCNELKNRGVQDILIACRDNLSGFLSAISTVFPKTERQLCIVHQIRNSTKYETLDLQLLSLFVLYREMVFHWAI